MKIAMILMNLSTKVKLQQEIYRLRFYSNSLIYILSLSISHNNVASIQKNRGDKLHHVIVALPNIRLPAVLQEILLAIHRDDTLILT